MIHTLIFGTPVRTGNHEFGTLNRVLVNNGVANQFTVNPGGLFGGPDRIVPISDVVEATEQGVTLNIADVDWKAYPAFSADHLLVSDQAAAPDLLPVAPTMPTTNEAWDVPIAEAPTGERSATAMVVALTNRTRVGDHGTLVGLVADTGIPQQLMLEGGGVVPFAQVGVLDEEHIVLGMTEGRLDGATALEGNRQAQQRMDGVTPPGSIGQERRHDP